MNDPSPSFTYERSKPIAIPTRVTSDKSKEIVEYNLTRHFFDPNKSSPPNSWNTRLMLRLGESRGEQSVQSNH
jgi:hypothetical protein